MTCRVFSFLLCLALFALLASAVDAQSADVADQRAYDLFNEIRCPVCSGQAISESDVPISVSIRQYVQTRIVAGDSDAQIKQSLVERYGQDILFEPVLAPSTLPLWIAPLGALFLLIGAIWYVSGRPRVENN